MEFNKRNGWILHQGWGNRGCMDRLGKEMLESSAMERDLGILVDGKLDMSQQCPGTRRANPVLGGASGTASQPDDGIQCKIHKFEDDTKVGEEADKSEGFADGLLTDWKRADTNLVKFKQREEREEGLLCLGEHYLQHQERTGT
ncbi:hypothetical protein TURU_018892 [Turdus rufiventris]|nr:hypothetical protein TURU_018892 [Turdus rufiventris]